MHSFFLPPYCKAIIFAKCGLLAVVNFFISRNWEVKFAKIKPSRFSNVTPPSLQESCAALAVRSYNHCDIFETWNKTMLCSHENKSRFPKDVSDRDLNYMRSHALQTPSQSRSGSAHCKVIFCSYCAVRADWPMHGFSAHFQNAHAWITFRKSFAFHIS